MEDNLNDLEEIARNCDRLDSLVAGLELPMPPQFHIEQLKEILPKISQSIKEKIVKISGENPWE